MKLDLDSLMCSYVGSECQMTFVGFLPSPEGKRLCWFQMLLEPDVVLTVEMIPRPGIDGVLSSSSFVPLEAPYKKTVI